MYIQGERVYIHIHMHTDTHTHTHTHTHTSSYNHFIGKPRLQRHQVHSGQKHEEKKTHLHQAMIH